MPLSQVQGSLLPEVQISGELSIEQSVAVTPHPRQELQMPAEEQS